MAVEMKIIQGFQGDFEIDLNTALGDGWLNETGSLQVTGADVDDFIYHTLVFRQTPEE